MEKEGHGEGEGALPLGPKPFAPKSFDRGLKALVKSQKGGSQSHVRG